MPPNEAEGLGAPGPSATDAPQLDIEAFPHPFDSMKLSTTQEGQDWLSQFRPEDAGEAIRILDELLFVSTSDFRQWIASEIVTEAKRGRIALYGEREFPPKSRFFPVEAPGKVRRAIGNKGPVLIKPRRGSPYIGSEGIVAQLISELAKRQDLDLLLTPGPDRLRPMKSRGPTSRLAIVTDVIGSGTRIHTMLDMLWRTPTVRSWHSHRGVKLEILVFSYAATESGLELVRNHRLRPKVIVRQIVPTLRSLGEVEGSYPSIARLCGRYDPRPWSEDPGPLGYKEAGTLIAFGHGCPNTTPRMFWAKGRKWRPLFPSRSAAELDLPSRKADIVELGERLASVNRASLSDPAILSRFGEDARSALLLLAAISHGLHSQLRLASRTALDVPKIENLLEAFGKAGWIDAANVITESGLAELRAAGRVASRGKAIPDDRVSMYFPMSLRG